MASEGLVLQIALSDRSRVIWPRKYGLLICQVWKASCLEGVHKDKSIAIKVIDLEQFVDNSIDDIRKEISIMSTC